VVVVGAYGFATCDIVGVVDVVWRYGREVGVVGDEVGWSVVVSDNAFVDDFYIVDLFWGVLVFE
jgi:hypothetical protein